jgi:hypothetical protein
MAVVKGIQERVHLPLYDMLKVEAGKQLKDAESTNTFRFFVDLSGKSKLETNLQAASQLPSYNTFEARAMRVVVSDLPPQFSEDVTVEDDGLDVTGTDDTGKADVPLVYVPATGGSDEDVVFQTAVENNDNVITAAIEIGLDRAFELLQEAREDSDGVATIDLDDDDVTLTWGNDTELDDDMKTKAADIGDPLEFTVKDLMGLIDDLDENEKPTKEQLNGDAANLVGKIIFNSVTTLIVGEKTMVEAPSWFFPSGAGVYSENGKSVNHGEPNPTATFRFAEPIFIDRQQNFRVEINVPDADTLQELQRLYGPLFIWVVLDGYMNRTVQ